MSLPRIAGRPFLESDFLIYLFFIFLWSLYINPHVVFVDADPFGVGEEDPFQVVARLEFLSNCPFLAFSSNDQILKIYICVKQ